MSRFAGFVVSSVFLAALFGFHSSAAIPSAEKMLPDDTLALVNVPDFTRLREIYKKSPLNQWLNDPAMKPFVEKFTSKWSGEILKPLERELGIRWEDYSSLAQGQLTFAVTQNSRPGGGTQSPGLLLLLDTRDKSALAKTNIAVLRKKLTDAGKSIRTEKIRGTDFLVLSMSADDVPKPFKNLFGGQPAAQETSGEGETKVAAPKNEIFIGQFESLLIVGTSLKPVEKVLVRLTGGSTPALDDLAAYHADHLALFRDAPLYGWINAGLLMNADGHKSAADSPDAFSAVQLEMKLASAAGFSSLKTAAFSYALSSEGSLAQIFLGVPDSSRQGIFKIMPGEQKDSGPPPFVPADAVKFTRWRIDGQKTWAALEKMLAEISPEWVSVVNLAIDTANQAESIKNPGFDLRKNLIGNLGDDFISYEKAPRGNTEAELGSPPSLYLIGSAHAEQLAAALRGVFVILPQGGSPVEREFLGRKIYSVTVPYPLFGFPEPGKPRTRTLSYATSGGYVALSTDASALEEYLRSSENPPKALRETSGLTEAMSKVGGMGAAIFGFENESQTMRATFQGWKNSSGPPVFLPLPDGRNPDTAKAGETFKDWVDFSLLPDFDKVSKYFHFTVYGSGATVDGLTFRMFWPVPPQLKKEPSNR